MKYKRYKRFLSVLIIMSIVLLGCSNDKWESTLYTPTMIQKFDNFYFIVDCWHHRIIYNDNLTDDISKWETLTDDINGSHSIASDGKLYLVDDTDNGKIRVFKKTNNAFTQTQILNNITGRPHYIEYDEKTKYFYLISSENGELRVMSNKNDKIEIVKSVIIKNLVNAYTRSFNIIDGYMYTVSANGYINKINYNNMKFDVIESFKVPNELVGMNYIDKIGDYYYISTYTNSDGAVSPMFVRTKDLNSLKSGEYEDLYNVLGFKGTPYFITHFDKKYFITEIDSSSGIKSFEVNNNNISNVRTIYYFKGFSQSSLRRKESRK